MYWIQCTKHVNRSIYLHFLAVDAHVGKHLFEECIKTFLKGKAVILVTHQIQYLKAADKILVLDQGEITHEGTFDYMLQSCEDISSFLVQESDVEEDEVKEENKIAHFLHVAATKLQAASWFENNFNKQLES